MEFRYKRDSNRNYMILRSPEKTDYQLKMVCENSIKGFLKTHTKVFNGDVEIYYDISSKQPLERLYAKKELNIDDIKNILFSIQAILAEAGKYLLDCGCILFRPDCGYLNPENKRVEWIFYPQEENSLQFLNLAEFLIDRVDHSDGKAVDVVYRFFRQIKEEDFIINDFMKIFLDENMVENIPEVEISELMEDRVDILEIPDRNMMTVGHKIKFSVLEKVRGILKKPAHIMPRKNTQWSKTDLVSSTAGGNVMESKEINISEWENFGMEDNYYSDRTVVMGIYGGNAKKILKNIGNGRVEDISLQKLPCVFGKMADCADVVLKDKSVSRIHARIFEKDEEIYLQDLNSTNGTYLNEIPLESNEILKLSVGDEIGFGNLRFRFE